MFRNLLSVLLFTSLIHPAFAQFPLSDAPPPRHRISTQLAYGNSTNFVGSGVMLFGEYGYRITRTLEVSPKVSLFHSIGIRNELKDCCMSSSAVIASVNLNHTARFEEKFYVRVGAGPAYQYAVEAYGYNTPDLGPNGTIVDTQRYDFEEYNEFGFNVALEGGVAILRNVDIGVAINTYGFVIYPAYISFGLAAGVRF